MRRLILPLVALTACQPDTAAPGTPATSPGPSTSSTVPAPTPSADQSTTTTVTTVMQAEPEPVVSPQGAAAGPGLASVSWYGDESGSTTASGEDYDPDALTFAHRSMPFGALVEFCRAGRCVVARCSDRGPFVAGRAFDLSRAAFESIAPLATGVAHVTWRRVSAEPSTHAKSTAARDLRYGRRGGRWAHRGLRCRRLRPLRMPGRMVGRQWVQRPALPLLQGVHERHPRGGMNAFTHLYEVTYEPPGNWRQEAACRGLDPDLFHPEQGERVDAAKAVCATCPSIQPCAIYALSSPMLSGVWGGLSGEERVQARQTTGRMKVCLECRKPFHGPVKSSPFCGDECRRTVRLRSKAESHRNAKAVA